MKTSPLPDKFLPHGLAVSESADAGDLRSRRTGNGKLGDKSDSRTEGTRRGGAKGGELLSIVLEPIDDAGNN